MNTRWIQCYLACNSWILWGEKGEFVSSDVKGSFVGHLVFPRESVLEQTNSKLNDSITFRNKLHARISICRGVVFWKSLCFAKGQRYSGHFFVDCNPRSVRKISNKVVALFQEIGPSIPFQLWSETNGINTSVSGAISVRPNDDSQWFVQYLLCGIDHNRCASILG